MRYCLDRSLDGEDWVETLSITQKEVPVLGYPEYTGEGGWIVLFGDDIRSFIFSCPDPKLAQFRWRLESWSTYRIGLELTDETKEEIREKIFQVTELCDELAPLVDSLQLTIKRPGALYRFDKGVEHENPTPDASSAIVANPYSRASTACKQCGSLDMHIRFKESGSHLQDSHYDGRMERHYPSITAPSDGLIVRCRTCQYMVFEPRDGYSVIILHDPRGI